MTSRQFYIIFIIGILSMKMQKMPCLIFNNCGKDGWLVFLMFILINCILICFVFLILKYVKPETVLKPSKNVFFNILRIIIMLLTMFYFLAESVLMYEQIQALFANTLFDDLSWAFFSLFLLFAVFFLAHRGIENIGLNFELYSGVIIGSIILISILGIQQTDFSAILPLQTINFKNILNNITKFNCWFGDSFYVLYLGIKAKDIKLSKTLFTYVLTMLGLSFMVIEMIGIYGAYTGVEPGLLSVLSEQSLLGLNIGRVDWFLILFAELGAILSCSVCLYFANLCFHSCFYKAKPIILKIINAIILYIFDIFILKDLNTKIEFFCEFMSKLSVIIGIVTFGILIIIAIKNKIKRKKLKLEAGQ